MSCKSIVLTAALTLAALPAAAQIMEVIPFAGYRTGDGVHLDCGPFSRLNITGDFAFGVAVDAFLLPDFAVELQWSRQLAEAKARPAGGVTSEKLFDTSVDQFLVNLLYHWGEPGDLVRPYFGGGLGFTRFGPDDPVDSVNKFAFDIAGGVKLYPSEHIGFRADVRLAPTYTTSSDSYFCDSFACWRLSTDEFFYQVEFTAGMIFRFKR